MREVMISIKPRWVELIASGKKTVEVRRTRPKCETPFKCYIYCTKDNTFAEKTLRGFDENGKAIYYKANKGKVIGHFICDKVVKFPHDPYDPAFSETADLSCVGIEGLSEYLGHKDYGYGLHITDLVVYDEPKELYDFVNYNKHERCLEKGCFSGDCWGCPDNAIMVLPPQSWGYVKAIEPRQTAD